MVRIDRQQKLQKNFTLMFWIQALLNVKVINVLLTLFYIHRGISVSSVFYLSIIWALSNILFEVPSSYMADRWGRKKTILVGIFFACMGWVCLLFGHSFIMFTLAVICSALQFASFSGTDHAIIYDTNKELNTPDQSLKRLSRYNSSQSIFKIITPLIAVLIARNLVEWQFVVIILVDVVATIIAGMCALRLVEPHHAMDVAKQEAGVLRDAVTLIQKNPVMIRAVLSRTIVFIAGFILWRYHQEFLVSNLGISVVWLGIAWSLHHVLVFVWEHMVTPRFHSHIPLIIDSMNGIFFFMSMWCVFVVFFLPIPLIILVSMIILFFLERIRWSLYAQFFNSYFNSFNRATTISLSNFLKSILDIPLLFIASLLVEKNMGYPFIFTAVLAGMILLFFRVSSQKYYAT